MSTEFDAIAGAHGPLIARLVAAVRALIERTIPDLTAKANPGWHAITYRHPNAGYVVGLFPFDDRVELVFERGASLPDPDGLFEPTEHLKQVRFIDLRPGKKLPRAALARLLHTAVHHGTLRRAGRRGVQVRQNTRHGRLSVQRTTVNELGRTLDSLAEREDLAELYVRGLRSYEALTVVERARFSAFLMHLIKLFEELYLLRRDGSLDEESWHGFERAMTDIVAYPGVREWWQTRKDWLHPVFGRFLEGRMARTADANLYREATEQALSRGPR